MLAGLPRLAPRPLLLELPPAVSSVGFAVDDHEAIISALAGLSFDGAPERAVSKRRAEFLAGRLAALHALRSLGFEAAPGRNEDGSPRWPALCVGSISHGAARALCAVARSSEVRGLGIDVERLMGADAEPELLRRICDEQELSVLSELPLQRAQQVSVAFSAKESLYKCLYPAVQRFMEFAAARVVAVSSEQRAEGLTGALTLELAVDWSSSFRADQRVQASFVVAPGHVETAVVLVD